MIVRSRARSQMGIYIKYRVSLTHVILCGYVLFCVPLCVFGRAEPGLYRGQPVGGHPLLRPAQHQHGPGTLLSYM